MPRTLKARILDPRTGKEDIAEFNFSDKEWETLVDFATYARELKKSSLVMDGIPTSLTLTWTQKARKS